MTINRIVSICDSIPLALCHFERELIETYLRVDPNVIIKGINTPSVEDSKGILLKIKLLISSVFFPQKTEGHKNKSIYQLWPTLGCWEIILWRKNTTIVLIHDPIPLRKQLGWSRIARAAATNQYLVGKAKILSLSEDAYELSRSLFPRNPHVFALHPICSSVEPRAIPASKVISILGQNKSARNLDLIYKLGDVLQAKGFTCRIIGRGWPEKLGVWNVISKFIEEEELDQAIQESNVILLPYDYFFQSGIAIRALENARLCVGPSNSFMKNLYGTNSENLVQNTREILEWVSAVEWATSQQISTVEMYKQDYTRRVDLSWAELNATNKQIS